MVIAKPRSSVSIHLAFDLYEEEPIPAGLLEQLRQINAERPDAAVHLHPPQPTADADTRARMAATMMANLNAQARSTSVRDIKELNLIPPQAFIKKEPRMLDDYRIFRWWQGR